MGIRRDARDKSAGNRTDAGSALGKDVRENGLVIVDDRLAGRDNELAVGDYGFSVDNDKLAAKIGKKMDVDDKSNSQAGNQVDIRTSNRPNADLIMITIVDIKADLIKDFNNGVLVVVLTELSYIIPDKYAIYSSAWILDNIIHNLFGNLSPFLMALSFSPLLFPLFTLITSNFGNLSTIFIYYMLICIQDFVPFQWLYFLLFLFPLCLLQPPAIPIIFPRLFFTICLFICNIF